MLHTSADVDSSVDVTNYQHIHPVIFPLNYDSNEAVMVYTFSDLPWFVRYSIFEYLLANTKQRLILTCSVDEDTGQYIVQGESVHPTYARLSIVSKAFAAECRTVLLRTSTILIQSVHDLSIVSRALSKADLAAVQSVTLQVAWRYENDEKARSQRTFECSNVTFDNVKATVPGVRYLTIDQLPGSDKLHSQSEFAALVDNDTAFQERLYNGWGFSAELTTLTANAYSAMADSVLVWLRSMMERAGADQVNVDVMVRFRCAGDPRLRLQEVVGCMNARTAVLVVEQHGLKYSIPQLFHEYNPTPSTLIG